MPAVAKKPAGSWKPAAPKLPPPPPPPDVAARLWLIAPGPKEAWTLRIDNEGAKAIRVPADVRLLSFEVEVPSNDPKQPKKKPTLYKCAAPDAMRPSGFPESRGLLLGPGQSYIESFDPRLFCFGKNAAALVGGAVVRTRFGWSPPPKWALAAKKGPTPPFAAEGTEEPATTTPLKQLAAPTIRLSYGTPAAAPAVPAGGGAPQGAVTLKEGAGASAEAAGGSAKTAGASAEGAGGSATGAGASAEATGGSAKAAGASAEGGGGAGAAPAAPAPIVDAKAPKLGVSMSAFSDASVPRTASVTVEVKNAGGRPMVAALRPRMIAFEVSGPDRVVTCGAWPPTHAIPREMYREYKPEGKTSFSILLHEVCPADVFSRPGLYRVKASVNANESGAELGLDAFTGKASATEPTLLRLQSSREPFYRDAPKAVPTPKPEMTEDDGEAKP